MVVLVVPSRHIQSSTNAKGCKGIIVLVSPPLHFNCQEVLDREIIVVEGAIGEWESSVPLLLLFVIGFSLSFSSDDLSLELVETEECASP